MAKPIVLVTGKNGQLGSELTVLSKDFDQFEFVFTDVASMDISDKEKVSAFFQKYKPVVCINAAAYTAVDKAETNQELAIKINADAVGNLARTCSENNTRLIHISTDYVFDGTASTPYMEDHPVSPVNFYGETKLLGERAAMENLSSTVIIRTSWVYSYYGNNFVKTMLRLFQERESVSVINDQFGSPTYAADLAEVIMTIAMQQPNTGGIYHFSNEGIISWYDFAIAIRNFSGLKCDVKAVDTSSYPTPAKRPTYSVMNKEKIKATFGIKLKDWNESLRQCIQLLQQ
jgi:dTDP-4-dehydrorhamnose reductase